MNGSVRREIVFSDHASVLLFECLIVAGGPATGLLHNTVFKDGSKLQITLQLLRDMWQRADMLFVPELDLVSLHQMECKTAGQETPIPYQILMDARKLSRYYIYLLFRYCMSSAGPEVVDNCFNRRCQFSQLPRRYATLLLDVPGSWLDAKVSMNYPSAPSMQKENMSTLSQQPQQIGRAHV